MTNLNALTPTQDERVIAALSHAGALLPMMGVIAPILIWITQKDKSRYVAFQALQALAYQFSMIIAYFIGMGCYMLSIFGMIFVGSLADPMRISSGGPLVGTVFFFPFALMGFIILGGFFFVGYAIIAAVLTFQGKPFRYALIGRAVERFMEPKQEGNTDP